jgi:hypothetical protein
MRKPLHGSSASPIHGGPARAGVSDQSRERERRQRLFYDKGSINTVHNKLFRIMRSAGVSDRELDQSRERERRQRLFYDKGTTIQYITNCSVSLEVQVSVTASSTSRERGRGDSGGPGSRAPSSVQACKERSTRSRLTRPQAC